MNRFIIILISVLYILGVQQSYAQGFIGISFKEVKNDTGSVVIITSVMFQSPAADAGLKPSDVIFSINNQNIHTELDTYEAIHSSIPHTIVPIEIIRNKQPKKISVQIDETKFIRVRISRESDYSFPYWLNSFKIVANGYPLGSIDNGETKDFYLLRTYDRRYNIIAKAEVLFESCVSDTAYVEVPLEYDISGNFTAGSSPFKIRIQFTLVDSLNTSLIKNEFRKKEYSVWSKITSHSSKAPIWFKDATLKTLDGIYNDSYRDNFFSPLLQAQPVFRLLNLVFVIYILLGILQRKLFLYIPIELIALYPATMLCSLLINNILFDQSKYYPFELVWFWAVCILICCLTIYAIKPLYELLTHSEEKVKKILGWLGVIFYFAELSKFIYEVIEWIRN